MPTSRSRSASRFLNIAWKQSMKKSKRLRQTEPNPPSEAIPKRKFVWWPWAAAVASLLLAFEIYGPALNGTYVLDDLSFPFADPKLQGISFLQWIAGTRPLLMVSFWLNHASTGDDPFA